MQDHDENFYYEPQGPPERDYENEKDEGYGFCPKCNYPLSNWGAASRGDGDIFDEIGCDLCQEVIREKHASYCRCIDCDPYGLKDDDTEDGEIDL